MRALGLEATITFCAKARLAAAVNLGETPIALLGQHGEAWPDHEARSDARTGYIAERVPVGKNATQ